MEEDKTILTRKVKLAPQPDLQRQKVKLALQPGPQRQKVKSAPPQKKRKNCVIFVISTALDYKILWQ